MAKNAPDNPNQNPPIEVVHDANSTAENNKSDAKQSGIQEKYEWVEDSSPNLIDSLVAPEFKPPFYARYHLLSILAALATIGWLAGSATYVFDSLGLEELSQLLPHELGGLAAGIVTPIALIWIVVAFFEKIKIYQAETQALRWHLQQLTYPADSAETHVGEITEALRAKIQALTNASEDASLRAAEASDLIKRQTLSLSIASEEAGIKADSAGDKLRQQAEDLVSASDRAIARAREAGNVLHHQSHDLINVSQQASARTLKSGVAEMSRLAEQSSERLEETSNAVRQRLDDLTASSDRAIAKLEGTADLVNVRDDQLSETARVATDTTLTAEKTMQQTAQTTSKAADQNLNKLKSISDALRRQTQDVSEASDRLSQKMGGSGAEMRQQLEDLTKTFNEALSGINAVGENVAKRADEAADVSNWAISSMETCGETTKRGTDDLTAASSKISKNVKEDSENVKQQTADLSKTSKQATEITDALKDLAKKSGHEDFLRRMALVSDGLQSVAIDINRIKETRITEDDWKRYNRGEKSVFLRKILGMHNRAKLNKINQLYRQDSNFREYVSRYLTQFDELIESARRSNQEGAFGTGFMTSDAGKVYMVLQSALARENGKDEPEA